MPSSTTRQIREMINNFLLDADETILDFVRSSRESFFIAMQQLGLLLGENEFLQFKAINDGLWREYEQGTVTKPQLMKERFARLFAALGVNADAVQANTLYFTTLCGRGYLLPGAEDFLRSLKACGKIFLITNGTPAAQYGRLRSLGLEHFFDGIFISDEIGFSKPDARFFAYVLDKAGLQSGECAVIGDSLTSDIRGANNAGILSIWYNAKGKIAEGAHPDHTARSYAKILEIVRSLGNE